MSYAVIRRDGVFGDDTPSLPQVACGYTRAQVQQILTNLGLYKGPIDGVTNTIEFMSAWMAFVASTGVSLDPNPVPPPKDFCAQLPTNFCAAMEAAAQQAGVTKDAQVQAPVTEQPSGSKWLWPALIGAGVLVAVAVIYYQNKPTKATANRRRQRSKFCCNPTMAERRRVYSQSELPSAYLYCPSCEQEEKHVVLPKTPGGEQKARCLGCGSSHKIASRYVAPEREWGKRLPPLPVEKPEPRYSGVKFESWDAPGGYQDYDPKKTYYKGDLISHPKYGKGIVIKEKLDKVDVAFTSGAHSLSSAVPAEYKDLHEKSRPRYQDKPSQFTYVGEIPRYMPKSEFMSLLTVRSLPATEQQALWEKFKTRRLEPAAQAVKVPEKLPKSAFFDLPEIRVLPGKQQDIAWEMYKKHQLTFPWSTRKN